MAKRTLNIVIDCGEKTCASEPGVFCPRLLTTHFGTRWVCGAFFDKECKQVVLHEDHESGWLQRCDQCLKAEQKVIHNGISVGDKVQHVLDLNNVYLEPYVVIEVLEEEVNVTSERDPDRWFYITSVRKVS